MSLFDTLLIALWVALLIYAPTITLAKKEYIKGAACLGLVLSFYKFLQYALGLELVGGMTLKIISKMVL